MTTIAYRRTKHRWNPAEAAEQAARAKEVLAAAPNAPRPGTMRRAAFDRLTPAEKVATVRNGVIIVD